MGGQGSGRYCRWSKTTTIEETKRIDIRFMRRNRMLSAGNSGLLSWTCGGEPAGSIRYICWYDHLVLSYRYREYGDAWVPVEKSISFDRSSCRFGGERLWFICPHCRRRCEVLCLHGKFPACRKCYRLPYRSQTEDRLSRLITKQEKLEEKLWKGGRRLMSTPKAAKLSEQLERVSEAIDLALCLRFRALI